MNESSKPVYQNFHYIQCQIYALQELIAAIAESIPQEEFRRDALRRLEALRNLELYSAIEGADARRKAIDHCEQWVLKILE